MNNIIPNISVDCVVFGFDHNKLNILLTKRILQNPETGDNHFADYTLQGHHVLENEDIDKAAIRVLKEKTGLENIFLEQFHTFGDVHRIKNPKDMLWVKSLYPTVSNHVITVGYYSLVDSSKIHPDKQHDDSMWFPADNLPDLGFDHHIIIDKALNCLRIKLAREPIGFELLPDKFTISQLQSLYEAVLGKKYDRRNFRKKIMQLKYIIPLDEKQKGVAHKPAQVFIFSKDVYERTKKEKFGFPT